MKVIAWIRILTIIYCYFLAKTYHPIRVPKNQGGKAKQTQFYPRFKLTLLSCRGSKPIGKKGKNERKLIYNKEL